MTEGKSTMAEPLIRDRRGSTKVYRRDKLEIPVLERHQPEGPAGGVHGADGALGLGQDDAPEPDRRASTSRRAAGSSSAGGTSRRSRRRELARWRSSTIGFIFQLYNLIPVLTAFENVELPLLLTKLKKKERRKHVETALSIVGLADRMDHYPRQLSGGQEQRVAIARAIVTDPAILVADEPTGDLDAKSAEEILVLLEPPQRRVPKTIVMVTHDPQAASRAHRMVHLDKGVLHAEELTETGTLRRV